MATISQRIREALSLRNMRQSELVEKTGITKSALSCYISGKYEPKQNNIYLMAKSLDVNEAWLMGLDVPMERVFPNKTSEITPDEFEKIVKPYRELDERGKDIIDAILKIEHENSNYPVPEPKQVRYVNYYYRLASAGTGQIIFDTPPTKSIPIPDITEYKDVDYAIGVSGDSMEPVYSDGDTLLVHVTNTIEIGEIGIFQVDGQCYVKKLGEKELISVNEERDNIPLNESATCMGRVVDKLRDI